MTHELQAHGTVVSPENPHHVQHNASEQAATPQSVAPINFEVNEFEDGDWKGFKFVSPEFTSIDAAIQQYGADKVLSLFNAQVNSRIRTKVKNALPKNLKGSELAQKQAELLSKNSGVLFTEAEANTWRPEVRELSPNQLFKQAKEAFAEMQKELDPAKKMELMQKGQALMLEAAKALAS